MDIEPREMDSNVEIAAPVVGDIGLPECHECCDGIRPNVRRMDNTIKQRKDVNLEKMSAKQQHCADGVSRASVHFARCQRRPDAILVNEGANTLDFARSIIDIYKPRKRLDVGTWGIMALVWGRPLPLRSRPDIQF